MAVDESSIVATEIENVDSKVPLLFEREDTFYSTIEKRNVEVISSVVGPTPASGAGGAMRIPLEIRPGSAFGYWDPNGGDMGRGDGSLYNAATISANHFILRVEWTYQSQISTDDQRKAVINNFKRLLSKSMAEFRAQIDRQCMTAGNGVLANPNALTIAGGTAGGDLWTVPATDGYGVRLLRFGQVVGVYDTTLATKRAEVKINFIDYPNRQVSTTPSLATAVNTDKLVASGLASASPVGLFGVPYHYSAASTGSWLGFLRANTPEIRANRVNAGGALALPFARLAAASLFYLVANFNLFINNPPKASFIDGLAIPAGY